MNSGFDISPTGGHDSACAVAVTVAATRRRSLVCLILLLAGLAASPAQAGTGICRVTPTGAPGNDGSSWSQPIDLPSALADADCSELWLAAGVYTPDDVDQTVSFAVGGGTSLYGGFAGTESSLDERDPALHRTVLSGDIGGDDSVDASGVTAHVDDIVGHNSHNVLRVDTARVGAVRLDGLTLTAGATVPDPSSMANTGAGLQCLADAGGDCDVVIRQVTLQGNSAAMGAGLVCIGADDGVCTVDVEGAAFVGNGALEYGAALLIAAIGNGEAQVGVRNATIAGNRGRTGTIAQLTASGGHADLSLLQVTVADNEAMPGAAGAVAVMAQDPLSQAELNGVIAWNNGSNPIQTTTSLLSIRHSMVEGGCPPTALCADLIGGDPQLGALQSVGATMAMLPDAASPAVNAIACDGAPALDQRLVPRPQGPGCDVGAIELRQAQLTADVTGPGAVSAVIVPPPITEPIAQCREDGGVCQATYLPDSDPAGVRLLLFPDVGQVVAAAEGCDGVREGMSFVTAPLSGDCTVSVLFGTPQHRVGGTVTGLLGTGLELTLNGDETLAPGADGLFQFDTPLAPGASYSVVVSIPPSQPSQHCVVVNGSGSIGDGDVGDVVVHCGAAGSYSVGGTLTGLATGETVTLSINGGAALTLAANGPYVFAPVFVPGDGYSVAVVTQPTGQHCTLSHDSGVVGSGPVDDVDVACEAGGADLQLSVTDDAAYAAYGRVRTYRITLVNAGNGDVDDVAVSATFDAAHDTDATQWTCLAGAPGASCGNAGAGGFTDTATLPAGTSAVWRVSVPTRADSAAAQATFVAHAEGASDAVDTNTLVIFRDGVDVPYGEAAEEPAS